MGNSERNRNAKEKDTGCFLGNCERGRAFRPYSLWNSAGNGTVGKVKTLTDLQIQYDLIVARIAIEVSRYDKSTDGSIEKQKAFENIGKLNRRKTKIEQEFDEHF